MSKNLNTSPAIPELKTVFCVWTLSITSPVSVLTARSDITILSLRYWFVVPNYFDTLEFKLSLSPKPKQIGFLGRINDLKGCRIIMEIAKRFPDVEFILTKIDGDWIFGRLTPNPNSWESRRKKPHSYSHSLDIKIAKAVINIAIHNNFNTTIIDPCCGIGTVVIEGRFSNLNIKGYEINPLVKHKCNLNLEHYGFNPDVAKKDMLESTELFDVAILDLPYGHYSNITVQEQKALIVKVGQICKKALIVTMEDMTDLIQDTGLNIIDSCEIKKSNTFKRNIYLCQK